MLEGFLPSIAICGAVGSVALLIYGGWLVWLFQYSAPLSHDRTVARLALHESLMPNESLEELKFAALGLSHRKPINSAMRSATPADQLSPVFDFTTRLELAAGDLDSSRRADELRSSQHSSVAIAKEQASGASQRVA
jgi:hypothetical protein